MTKNESKLLSIQGIAKASAFCLLLSAFSVNAAMAAPAPAGTVDEVMAVQQGKKVTGVVVDGTGEPVIGANVVVKGTTNGTITDFDGNYTIEGVPADGVLVISYIGYLSQEIPVGNQSAINVTGNKHKTNWIRAGKPRPLPCYQDNFINLFSHGAKLNGFPETGSPTTSQTVVFTKLILSEATEKVAGFPPISRN